MDIVYTATKYNEAEIEGYRREFKIESIDDWLHFFEIITDDLDWSYIISLTKIIKEE